MTLRRSLGFLLCATLLSPALLRAQERCALPTNSITTTAPWHGPLQRSVTLRADDISLAEALQRIADAAGVRFSYSPEAVPVDRRVCVAYHAVPVGQALHELLRGIELEPRVVNDEHIVLAPTRARTDQLDRAQPSTVVSLEQLLVRSSPTTSANDAATGGTFVVEGRMLAQQPSATLAAALNGIVPGLWLWQDAASGVASSYGSVRGASSFRATSPKVYIDGIEVANSQLLGRIAPATVERIEIIRGPQGAALYGANALSGVINIITRRDHVEGGSPLRYVQGGFGAAASDFATGTTLSQEHSLSLAVGANGRSAGLNLSFGTLGEYAPDAGARHVVADAFGRIVGTRSVITASVRFLGERAGIGRSPLLPDSLPIFGFRSSTEQAAQPATRQYTLGLSARLQPTAQWTHSLLVGVDGYNADQQLAALPFSAVGTDVLSDALRASARVSSVRSFAADVTVGTVTLAAEHSLLRQRGTTIVDGTDGAPTMGGHYDTDHWGGSAGSRLPPHATPKPPSVGSGRAFDQVMSNTGLSAQSAVVWNQLLHLTAGVRLEQNGAPFDFGPWAVLPMTGSAVTVTRGPVGLKLHAAYGKAIRWPAQPSWATSWQQQQYFRLTQPPEEQSGVEAGVDVRFGDVASLQLTRFDQTATGATQQDNTSSPPGSYSHQPLLGVGTIENRGWEVHASWQRGHLSLGGTVSFVDSRVTDLAPDYDGDLHRGDRMLLVPAQTASLSAAWTETDWSASISAARARDWINYDRLALLNDLAGATDPITGDALRPYWRSYDGHTHLSATVTRQLTQRFLLTLTGTNLFDAQVGEPDNITIVPGRTFSLGIRARF